MRSITPSSLMMKVVRKVPIYLRPYMLFSPHTPNCSTSFLSVSAIRVKQVVLFDEFLVRLLVVYTDSDNFVAGLTQVGIVVAQVAACAVQPEVESLG